MSVLAQHGHRVPQIARVVLRSEDTVARVLKRFAAGDLDAIPRCTPSGRNRPVTEARARRVGAGDRMRSARGGRGQRHLDDRVTGRVSGSADRNYGHPRDGSCLLACPRLWRPRDRRGPMPRKAEEKADYVGKRLRVEVL